MDKILFASSSPHIRTKQSTRSIMLDVLIALLPATLAGIYYFRFNAAKLILLSVLTAVLTEYLIQKLRKQPVTIGDLSAAVTGLLLAFNLPASAPWWIAVIGSVFAVGIVKQAFGGLGHNFMNPALAARAMLVASWPVIMTGQWISTGVDAVTTATPLGQLKEGLEYTFSAKELLLGNVPGCIGETSAILLILGGVYLIFRKIISWRIPTMYIGTVAILMLVAGQGLNGMITQVLAGGLMLGAFFMATDYASSPVSPKGQIIYAVGCGILTVVIRLYGGYPEGVSYSILLMNLAAPLIDKYTRPKVFGVSEVKKHA
ncbi:MAG: RnfABCDGE type electron transport complex subunit D [Tissierellales bacterium]|nr:RnfABCDGE type electron transport complex subunit D [Tissierellales bacterium]